MTGAFAGAFLIGSFFISGLLRLMRQQDYHNCSIYGTPFLLNLQLGNGHGENRSTQDPGSAGRTNPSCVCKAAWHFHWLARAPQKLSAKFNPSYHRKDLSRIACHAITVPGRVRHSPPSTLAVAVHPGDSPRLRVSALRSRLFPSVRSQFIRGNSAISFSILSVNRFISINRTAERRVACGARWRTLVLEKSVVE